MSARLRAWAWTLALATAGAQAAVVVPQSIERPEGARSYLLATPDQPLSGARPLLILLHGRGGSAAQVLGRGKLPSPLSLWLEIADRERWIVVAPNGVNGSDGKSGWNDCRADAPSNPRVDDIGFIKAIIDAAIARGEADPSRIYVMGMSNGGIMALRAASELGERLAAVAAISAGAPANSRCAAPRKALPLLLMAGTGDTIVPYQGGTVLSYAPSGGGVVLGAEATVAQWRQLARLPETPQRSEFPHRDSNDATRASRQLWGADAKGLQVELLTVADGGHAEPSQRYRFGPMARVILGAQNADVEAAVEAWTFFRDKRAAATP